MGMGESSGERRREEMGGIRYGRSGVSGQAGREEREGWSESGRAGRGRYKECGLARTGGRSLGEECRVVEIIRG